MRRRRVAHLGRARLDRQLHALERAPGTAGRQRVSIDCGPLEALDTVGAWLILRLKAALARRGAEVSLNNLATRFAPLLEQVEKYHPDPAKHRRGLPGPIDLLAALGVWGVDHVRNAGEGLGFLGEVTLAAGRVITRPRRIRLVSFVSQMQHTGPAALPIVGLLSFLIGIVIAYQGAEQLRQFGAEIFTVNLLGIAFLRELGVLLTAIIIAGRSGSAFTAEIGTMQVNEEIDAMITLGLDPIEVLVLPRVVALMVTLPLMTFFANVMGLLGGARSAACARHSAAGLSLAVEFGDHRLDVLARHHQGAVLRRRDRARRLPRRACASRAAPKASAATPPCPSSNPSFW